MVIPTFQTSARIVIATNADNLLEGSETFIVTLSNPRGRGALKDATATVTIVDGPTPPQLPIDDVTVVEGGEARVTVSLERTSAEDVTFTWATSDGAAEDGSDYTGQSGQTATIPAGRYSANVTVQTINDGEGESDETFTVELGSPVNANLGDATGEATITDNDDAPDPNPDPDPNPNPNQWDHNGLTLTGTNAYDYLAGANDNDLIDGRGGPDWIDAGFGDDRMTGGKGADSFVISSNRGHDVITDFSPDEGDTVILAGPDFSNFGQMLESHAEQDGDDMVIYTSPDREAHSLTLLDTKLSALDAAQFMIVGGYSSSAVTSAHFQATAFAGRHEPLYLRINESPVPVEDADFAAHSLAVFHPAESQGDLIW